MKKLNKSRQALLQKKRTKRNQSRKGVKYNPNKMLDRLQNQPDLADNNTRIAL